MDKVTIRFGKGLQRVLRDDSDFFKEPTLQTAFAFVGFVTSITSLGFGGGVPLKSFKVRDCDIHETGGLIPGPKTRNLLERANQLSDRVSVEFEIDEVPHRISVRFHFYGSGKNARTYLQCAGIVESDCIRKFPLFRFTPEFFPEFC
ncbi:MAG: hypothetical protein V4697_03810 [Patescibacteria group bacterium]